ncbi:MAG: hypothetical protein R2856_16105 [Caldilineaceae bacterium]
MYPILTEAVLGDAFTVLGRNEDGTWLRVCCVQSTQESWVATEFMALDAPIDTLPILETPEPPATRPRRGKSFGCAVLAGGGATRIRWIRRPR